MESTIHNFQCPKKDFLSEGNIHLQTGRAVGVISKNPDTSQDILIFLRKMWNLEALDYIVQNGEGKKSLRECNSVIVALSRIAKRETYTSAIKTQKSNNFKSLLSKSITNELLPRLRKIGIESFKLICDETTFTDFDSLSIVFSNNRV